MKSVCAVTCSVTWVILTSVLPASARDVTGVTFSASPVAPGTPVNITVNGSPDPCSAVEINFGDGVDVTFGTPTGHLPFSQQHTYQTPGAFTVTATGHGNCTHTASATLQVATPVGRVTDVSVSASPTRGTPLTVTVFATPPCGVIQIDFGDGTSVSVPGTSLPVQQTHTYAQAHAFTVVARGQTNCGGQIQTSISVATPLGSTGTGVINTQPAPSGPPRVNPPPLPILGKPDLVADLAGSPATADLAPDLFYSIAVRNLGNASASNFFVTIQLPREVTFGGADSDTIGPCQDIGQPSPAGGDLIKCTRTSPLAAGGVANVRLITHPVHGLGDNTTLRLTVLVDPSNSVAESNESNNVVQFSTVLRGVVDLAITSISIEKQGFTLPDVSGQLCNSNSQANTTVRIHVVNNGPGGSLTTTLGIAWASGITPEVIGNGCGPGESCVNGACILGPVPTPSCFDSCAVPALFPGTGADVVVRVRRTGDPADMGVATIDPARSLNDPNRANNFRHVQ
jgi:uncharacterized repeat protein (TIGR01451 family)